MKVVVARKKTEVDRRLDALAKETPDRPLSAKELVALHSVKIADLRAKRHSWERIGEAIGVKPNTLRQYFGRTQSLQVSPPKPQGKSVASRDRQTRLTSFSKPPWDEEV